ncbi:MAG: PRC-barrel domain-containing protein [Desulfobacterales bacterium]
MQFKENAVVMTFSGQKVGRIERVVIDPKSHELTHFVVKKGFLFTEDKVIAIDDVESATEERVLLKEGRQDPDDFPDFEETHYVPVKDDRMAADDGSGGRDPLAWYYPLPGGAWWQTKNFTYPGMSKPVYVRRTDVNIPDGTVALEEGAKVLSADGEHVGDIERVYVDDDEQRVTHLLISQGLVSKSRRLIPSMWVDSVSEEIVRLSVGERFIEALPQYTPRD